MKKYALALTTLISIFAHSAKATLPKIDLDEFVQSACDGDLDKIGLFLNGRTLEVNYVAKNGETALTCAAKNGKGAIIEALLGQSYFPVDVNKPNRFGYIFINLLQPFTRNATPSPLFGFLKSAHIFNPSDFLRKDPSGKSIFQTTNSDFSISDLTDATGPAIGNIVDPSGQTLLLLAIQAGNTGSLDFLIKQTTNSFGAMAPGARDSILSTTVRRCNQSYPSANGSWANIAVSMLEVAKANKDTAALQWGNSYGETLWSIIPIDNWTRCADVLSELLSIGEIPSSYFTTAASGKTACEIYGSNLNFWTKLQQRGALTAQCLSKQPAFVSVDMGIDRLFATGSSLGPCPTDGTRLIWSNSSPHVYQVQEPITGLIFTLDYNVPFSEGQPAVYVNKAESPSTRVRVVMTGVDNHHYTALYYVEDYLAYKPPPYDNWTSKLIVWASGGQWKISEIHRDTALCSTFSSFITLGPIANYFGISLPSVH